MPHTLRLILLGLMTLCLTPAVWAQASPNGHLRESHELLLQIEQEVRVLKRLFGSEEVAKAREQFAKWHPRHLWHKAYGLQLQVNIFRRHHGLFGFTPVALEPGVEVSGPAIMGQLQRLLTELRIVRMLLKVKEDPATEAEARAEAQSEFHAHLAAISQESELHELYEHLAALSHEMDALNGESISSSYVYAEAMRIEADLNLILPHLGIDDRAIPPAALEQASSSDSLKAAYGLMQEIQRLQQRLGLEITDFSGLLQGREALPEDTFNMLLLCVAELQPLKARLGLAEAITPPAVYQHGKTPVQVTQLLGYMINQMRLIRLN